MTQTISEEWSSDYNADEVPQFIWIKINGKEGVDDITLSIDHRIQLNEKAFNIIERHRMDNCDIQKNEYGIQLTWLGQQHPIMTNTDLLSLLQLASRGHGRER